ncbi:MAG: hypothetical protein ACYS0F_01325, partial [Planctomycetota bacterium]
MKARWVILLLAALGGAIGVLFLQNEVATHQQRERVGAEGDEKRHETATLIEEGGRAVDSGKQDAEAGTAPESNEQVWYGLAIDRRTATGEPNARVRVEGHPSAMIWEGGYSLEGGIFVVPVPTDVPAKDRLRIVVETSDERIGMLGVTRPTLRATDVGRIYLRSRETLTGRCVGRGQVPIGSVKLTLRPYGELKPHQHAIASAQTDDAGYFEFRNIPRGLYALTGRGPEGELFVETGVVVPRFKPLITQARATEPFRFTVRNTMNEPIPTASVVARLRGPEAKREPLSEHLVLPALHATTDTEGEALTQPALPGRYDVQLLHLGIRYDFTIARSPARLIIPTDPRVLVRFTRDERPLKNVKLVTAQGRVTTDADGIVALPRGSPPEFRVGARQDLLRLVGQGSLKHARIKEGQISLTVKMRREAPVPDGGGQAPSGGRERRVCVTYPDGKPVEGARIHGGIKIVRTCEDGWADVGFVS